jgi:hypothetical protein
VHQLLVPIAKHMFILMDLCDKLFTQFSSNLSKRNATGHLQHPVRHVLNVWSPDLHVGSHTVATAANPARMMNRALKQQATELGPNMWQQQQGIAKYVKKSHIFLFLHHNHLQVGQQHCKYTAGMQARLPIYCSLSLPKCSDCFSLTHILWLLGSLPTGKDGRGTTLLTNHAK